MDARISKFSVKSKMPVSVKRKSRKKLGRLAWQAQVVKRKLHKMCDESSGDHKMDFSEDKVCDMKIEADGTEYDGDDHDNNLDEYNGDDNLDEYTEFEIKTEITIDQVQLFKVGEQINESSIADPSIENNEFVCTANGAVCTSTIGDESHPEGVDYVKEKTCNNKSNIVMDKDFEYQNQSFVCDEEYEMHNSKYSGKSTFTCSLCGARKKTRLAIENHYVNNHCSLCNWSFPVFREIKRHVLLEHAEVTKYFCTYCNVMFQSADQKNSHMILEHGNMNRIKKCDVCDKDIPFRSDLTFYRHFLLHRIREEVFLTGTANSPLFVKPTKKTIVNKHTSYIVGKYIQVIDKSVDLDMSLLSTNVHSWICMLCHSVCDDKESFDFHMNTQHKVLNETGFYCEKCNKHYPTQESLQAHLKTMHVAPSSIELRKIGNKRVINDENGCPVTAIRLKSFKAQENYVEFKKASRYDGSWNCQLCPYKTRNTKMDEFYFDQHLKRMHGICNPEEQDTIHKCPHCQVKYTKKSLEAHLNFIALQTRVINDEIGSSITAIRLKSLEAQENYVEFKKASRYNGSWNCQLCPYKTKNTKMDEFYFDLHLKRIHGVSNPEKQVTIHKCPHCQLKYTLKTDLQSHMSQSHGGDGLKL